MAYYLPGALRGMALAADTPGWMNSRARIGGIPSLAWMAKT